MQLIRVRVRVGEHRELRFRVLNYHLLHLEIDVSGRLIRDHLGGH